MQDPYLGPTQLTLAGTKLFFTYFDINNGQELWTSDGTFGGTHRIADPDPANPFNNGISNLTAMGSRLYFLASDTARGSELWTSDGTAAGTHIVRDLRPGAAGADIRELKVLADQKTLVFTARDGIHGREVWMSDGTDAGTVLTDDVAPGAVSSAPHGLFEGDDVIGFHAADDRRRRSRHLVGPAAVRNLPDFRRDVFDHRRARRGNARRHLRHRRRLVGHRRAS
jgi:ELWxxDGT repeat protein